jgi:hypothetical protein
MFTRRPIAASEEMCISYMGVPVRTCPCFLTVLTRPQDDEDEPAMQPIMAPKHVKKGSKAKRAKKNKTSAKAHVVQASNLRPDCRW